MIELRELFSEMVRLGASDLHLVVGAPPQLRVHGALETISGTEPLMPEHTRELVFGILSNEQRQRLEVNWEIDFSYAIPGLARWRVNAFFQRGTIGAAFRVIPEKIKPLEDLGVPDALFALCDLPRGLVLVTGPTGSGKSTTLASMIDVINETRCEHILTVEDPIEFIHKHKNCVINQREVGADTEGFARALKSALRQDPDVILVGEMRDLETIQTALTAAETGHLVFGTLHTNGAAKTVDRIIDVFPPHQQDQIRVQLASSLQGVVTQTLVPTKDGRGRIVASEVMVPNPAIRNLIREGKVFQIPSVMQTSQDDGMQTLDACLATLVRTNKISLEEAVKRCAEEPEFHRLLSSGSGAPLPGYFKYTPPQQLRLQRKFGKIADASAEPDPSMHTTPPPVPVAVPTMETVAAPMPTDSYAAPAAPQPAAPDMAQQYAQPEAAPQYAQPEAAPQYAQPDAVQHYVAQPVPAPQYVDENGYPINVQQASPQALPFPTDPAPVQQYQDMSQFPPPPPPAG